MKIQEHTSELKAHTYKPLPSYLTIKQSPIHGLGLFAKDKGEDGYIGQLEFPGYILKGKFIGVSHIHSALFDETEFDFSKAFEENEVITQMEENGGIYEKDKLFLNGLIRTPLGGFINHSDNANLTLNYLGHGCWGIIADKNIHPGEELTLDYKYTPCGVIMNNKH